MVWFNCITAFRSNLDDAASHANSAHRPTALRRRASRPQLKRHPEASTITVVRLNGARRMIALAATAMLPFLPRGQDYDSSRTFFAELGFEELWENDGYAGF